ncbi:MAG: flippase [Gammaproteobacteria bacterium]|nr:flippase [Gammaproteobacteria bacterium]
MKSFWGNLKKRIQKSDLLSLTLLGAGFAFIIQTLGVALKYIAQVLLARWLGPTEYGIYSYIFTWANVIATFATLGLTIGIIKFIPEYVVHKKWCFLKGIISQARLLVFGSGIALGAGSYFALLYTQSGKVGSHELLLGMSLVPLLALTNIQAEMLRSLKHIITAYAPPLVLQQVILIGLAYNLKKYFRMLTSKNALMISLTTSTLIIVIQHLILHTKLPPKIKSVKPCYETHKWLRTSLPLLVTITSSAVLNQADIVMLGLLIGPKEAGVYTAATKTATLVSFLLAATNKIIAPTISELYTQKRYSHLANLIRSINRLIFWPTLATVIILVLGGPFLLKLFGEEFTIAYYPLIILAMGQLINAVVGPVGYLISLTGYQNISALVLGFSALLNIILNAILIPYFGLIGAAIATASSIIFWNIALYLAVKRLLNMDTFAFNFLNSKRNRNR